MRLSERHFGLHSAAVSQNIKSVLVEERRFPPAAEFTAHARLKPEDVAALKAEAAANYKGFWARQAQDELRWHKPFKPGSRRRTRHPTSPNAGMSWATCTSITVPTSV